MTFSMNTAAVGVALCTAFAGASVTITGASTTATATFDMSGSPSDSGADSSSLQSGPLPQTISSDLLFVVPPMSGSSMTADLSSSLTVSNLSAVGSSDAFIEWTRGGSGVTGASLRTFVYFTVVGSIQYDLDASFALQSPGNFLSLKDGTGAQIEGTPVGATLDETGVLGPGTYTLEFRLNRSASGSGGTSLLFDTSGEFSLVFSEVPAPGAFAVLAMGLGAATRRRRG